MKNLPPLPEPCAFTTRVAEGQTLFLPRASLNTDDMTPVFTLSQLQADRLAVWNAAIRKAAEVAADEDQEVQGRGHYDQLGDARATQHNIVSAIRLLEETN